MFTLNGIGRRLYGKRDAHPQSGTYTTTLYVVLLFVPLLPLVSYRVVRLPGGYYQFLAKHRPERADWLRIGKVWIGLAALLGVLQLIWPGK